MKPLLSAAAFRMCLAQVLGFSLVGFSAQAETAIPLLVVPFDEKQSQKSDKGIDAMSAQLLTKIEVHSQGTEVIAVIAGDGRLSPEAKMLDESRLVIDLPAVASAVQESVIRGNHRLLNKIRVGYHADKIRLVFDVLEHPQYSISSIGNQVTVTLRPTEQEAADLSKDAEKLTAPVLVTRAPEAELSDDRGQMPRPLKRATRMASSAASKYKVQTVQMAADGSSSNRDGRSDDIVAGQTHFVGRRVSLDFQQADITNILRLIAEVSGFNIVVGEGVKSKVTMKLVSVPWDQALDMLLKMNGLGMIRQGTIVWVDTLANIAKQQDEEAKAKDSKTKAEELVDRVFYIKNLQAQELQTSLRQYLSPRGVMQVSQGSNALIVRETESKLAIMKQLVDGLDLEVPQVQIEARIVQADTVYARGLGVQWGVKDSNFGTNNFSLVGNVTGPFAAAAGTGTQTITRDFLVNLPAQVGGLPAVPAVGFTFGKLADGFGLDMRLSAGELLGLTKVIAAPKITTLDKREAKISQGESIPFQTTSLQGTQTTFVDANLELNVTPQITSRDPKEIGKTILLRVRATRNAVGARSNPAGPSIDRREATTQVIVRDGETMVIGGVFVDTQNNNVQGVPYLSRIPVLGWLFKNKSESVSKQELLIFLTPSIVKT